jgi:SOS-response transcriptional repressor LexA
MDDDAATDELVRLAAQRIDDDAASELAFDERRLQWQGEEERRRIEEDDLNGAHRLAVMQLARRIQAAALLARLPIRRRDGRPTIRVGNGRDSVIDATGRAGLDAMVAEDRLAPRVDLGVAAGVGRDLWDEPCDSWIELPLDMPAGRYIGLGVNGDSMEPLMHTGDTILVRVGTDVQQNTVIVARHPDDGYVVKRVDRLTPTTIQLASLNAGYPMLAIPRDPSLIVGTVVLRWCAHE